MKRTPGMGMHVEPDPPKLKLPKMDCHSTTSTLNGDDSDKGVMQHDQSQRITVKDSDMSAREAPFEDRFRILSRPFQYLIKINAKDQESKYKRMIGHLDKNITNNIWASGLAEEIQYIIICEIKHTKPAIRIRDAIIVSNTKYMVQIFEQILDLFESKEYSVKYDIEGLFELLTESIYRLEGTITPTFDESISFNDTRKILREYKNWVIESRSEFINKVY